MKEDKQSINIKRDLLDGNLNRMMITNDLQELNNMYYFAKQRLEAIYNYKKDYLEELKKTASG